MSSRPAARGSEAARSIRLALRTSSIVAVSSASPSRCFLFWPGRRARIASPIVLATVAIPPTTQPHPLPIRPHAPRRRLGCAAQETRGGEPPRAPPVAGLVFPSVVGTGPPHHAVRREPAGQSKARGAPGLSAHGTTHGLTGSRVPATGPRRGGTARPRPEPVLLATRLALPGHFTGQGRLERAAATRA